MSDWSFGGASSAPPKRRGRGLLITGAVLLLLGIVIAVAGGVSVSRSASGLIDGYSSTYSTPGEIDRRLEGGQSFVVFEDVGPSGESPASAVPRLSSSDVTVVGPGGYAITLVEPSAIDAATYDDGDRTYAPIATFDATTTGPYVITVSAAGGDVMVTPGVGQIARAGLSVLGIALGALVGIIGLVLLIIGGVLASRRPAATAAYGGTPYAGGYGTAPYGSVAPTDPYASGASYPVAPQQAVAPQPAVDPMHQWQQAVPAQPPAAPPTPQALPPAAWYPDPQRPGGRRYWDGARWTDHRA